MESKSSKGETYKNIKYLGEGSFGKVMLFEHKKTKLYQSVKMRLQRLKMKYEY